MPERRVDSISSWPCTAPHRPRRRDHEVNLAYVAALLTAAPGTSRTSGNVRLESAKWAKADIDQVAIHEVQYRENNDDHPVSMTPPIIDATDDIRWIVGQIVRALDKPVLEVADDTVRPEDWHLRPLFKHSFREAGPVPPVSTEVDAIIKDVKGSFPAR